jgi:hypothetical protein
MQLVGRGEAAQILSINVRSVDYLLANRQLIPVVELRKFARMNHPEPIAS